LNQKEFDKFWPYLEPFPNKIFYYMGEEMKTKSPKQEIKNSARGGNTGVKRNI